MDIRHRRRARHAFSRFLLAWVVLAGLIGPAGTTATQAEDLATWANAFPDAIGYDLPAMAMPAADFPVPGLVAVNGRMLRPVEEAGAFVPVLGIDQEALLQQMRETRWKTRYVAEVVRPGGGESAVDLAGWSSIAEHEDAAGAMAGFALLDESGREGVEVLEAPALGDASRLTRYVGEEASGRAFERIRYTFVSDRLIGSVAFFWYDEARSEALEPAAMVDLAARLLERMTAVASSDAPNLPGMIVRMDPTASLAMEGHLEGYHILDGAVIPQQGDTLVAIQNASAFQQEWGVQANYMARTAFTTPAGDAHRGYYLVQLFRLGSEADAARLVRGHTAYDETLGYDQTAELTELPAVDGAVAGVSYTIAWNDGVVNDGYRIWIQAGATAVVVEASAPGGVPLALVFDLVAGQLACLETGACAPIPAPFGASDGGSTPVA